MKLHYWLSLTSFLCALVLGVGGCGVQSPEPSAAPLIIIETAAATEKPISTAAATEMPIPTTTATAAVAVEQLSLDIHAIYPHDPMAFTEGLVFDHGKLYESTGEYGASALREVDLATGQVLRSRDLPSEYFGEGLALVKDHLIQLTWREQTAFIYDQVTLTERNRLTYDGEGWGMCFDGQHIYVGDGSSTLTVRNPDTFEVEDVVAVTRNGQPVQQVNELECVGDFIYANVWHTNEIIRIMKATETVTGVVDASGLLTPEEEAAAGPEGVLNGIAYDPQQDVFLITGKRWPKLFEVRFVQANPTHAGEP